MGAQWKHAGRTASSAKRGAMISKIVKEITVAAKSGDPNPDGNARLRAAIETAKKASVPRDTIDRALKKASGQADGQAAYELVTYEGFAPHQVPVIVECLTDNKNRTASDIRVLFRKGQLGSIGSVAWNFMRVGVIEGTIPQPGVDIEETAIEAGAQNTEPLAAGDVPAGHSGARFITETADLDSVSRYLVSKGWTLTTSELSYQAKNPMTLSEKENTDVVEFLHSIDDHDDVHRIYAALK